jgi:hypothetical protein
LLELPAEPEFFPQLARSNAVPNAKTTLFVILLFPTIPFTGNSVGTEITARYQRDAVLL